MLLLRLYPRFCCLAWPCREHWLASTFHGREHTSIQSTQYRSACRRFVPCSQSTSGHLQSSGTQVLQDQPCRGVSDATLQSTLLTTLAERPLAVFPCRLSFGRATAALDCCFSPFCITFMLFCSIHARPRVFNANGATCLCLNSHCSLCCSANLHLRLPFIASTKRTRQRVLSSSMPAILGQRGTIIVF